MEAPDGTELVLEPDAHPAVRPFKEALVADGIPYTSFAVDDVHEALERVRTSAEVVSEPRVIFRHEDDRLGPAGTDEWHAFVRDSEGNLVGLVSWSRA